MTKPLTLSEALRSARETRRLEIGPGILSSTPSVFKDLFGQQPSVIVADENTMRVAGESVLTALRIANQPVVEPFIFRDADLYAEFRFVEQLEASLKKHSAIPIAVGSGTLNDLTKLAAHRTGRQYMSIATAASMDGYTAFGASITYQGSKQTFTCPAPAGVVADSAIICAAPVEMNASGYADLVAKITAGADWIIADALAVEPIDPTAWAIVQGRLREMIADAAGVRAKNPQAIAALVEGLMLGGFAMQSIKSSRPASGAEHQFSHLWDMQHHTHNGHAPSHGFKVGIAMLAVTAFYETFLARSLDQLDIEKLCVNWPDQSQWLAQVRTLFGEGDVATVAAQEIAAKSGDRELLRAQLTQLCSIWPQLQQRLRAQLIPFTQLRNMLRAAGAPVEPESIGITRERLRDSFRQAFFLRRRFTVLDLAVRAGLLDACVAEVFGPNGPWPIKS